MSVPIRRLIGLAETCVFSKQSLDPIHCGPGSLARSKSPSRARHPFFRSYGVILPSSFCKTHSSTLGYSPHLPVSVYGTDTRETRIEVFLGSMLRTSLLALRLSPSPLGVVTRRICLADPPTGLDRHIRSPAGLSLLRHPIASWSPSKWYRNIDLFSIAYAFRPRLRIRLTLSGLTFLRKP